jgi:hypothetical protein
MGPERKIPPNKNYWETFVESVARFPTAYLLSEKGRGDGNGTFVFPQEEAFIDGILSINDTGVLERIFITLRDLRTDDRIKGYMNGKKGKSNLPRLINIVQQRIDAIRFEEANSSKVPLLPSGKSPIELELERLRRRRKP